jgi:tyrosyl-tRNA synthetase
MSKSYGNYIALEDPPSEMFGKIMSISDVLMLRYYELLTDHDLKAIQTMHPMEAKLALAEELVAQYHSREASLQAHRDFDQKFRKREFLGETITLSDSASSPVNRDVVSVLVEARLAKSKGDARRLIQQGAVDIDGQRITDVNHTLAHGKTYQIKVGKKQFASVSL